MLRMLLGPVLGPVRPIVLFFEPFRSIWLLGPVQIQQIRGLKQRAADPVDRVPSPTAASTETAFRV